MFWSIQENCSVNLQMPRRFIEETSKLDLGVGRRRVSRTNNSWVKWWLYSIVPKSHFPWENRGKVGGVTWQVTQPKAVPPALQETLLLLLPAGLSSSLLYSMAILLLRGSSSGSGQFMKHPASLISCCPRPLLTLIWSLSLVFCPHGITTFFIGGSSLLVRTHVRHHFQWFVTQSHTI